MSHSLIHHTMSDYSSKFFALRLLNKRGRVRLSEQPHKLENLPARGVLFATANSKGCFAAAICSASGQHSAFLVLGANVGTDTV